MADDFTRFTRSSQINLRAGDLLEPLGERVDASMPPTEIVRRDLNRYYALIKSTLARWSLTVAQASLIVDALNGIITEPHTAHLLWAEVDDAIREDGLAEKWGVDGESLVWNLRRATPFEALAIADAVERFWRGPYHKISIEEGLLRVGLIR